ncbi:Hypothetical protein, putative, partial [Bodo saltans]
MPPSRRRPQNHSDPAVITRIEALSKEIHYGRSLSPFSPLVGHAERRQEKREKKLDKLHDEVVREQLETEVLRDNLDQSFREVSAHHSQFLQWYREKNRQIDAKYAKLGVRCPFVTGRGDDAFKYPFRQLEVTSPVTGGKAASSTLSPVVSIDMDQSGESPTMGVTPSPMQRNSSLLVRSTHHTHHRATEVEHPTSWHSRITSPKRQWPSGDIGERVPVAEYAPHGCLAIATTTHSSSHSAPRILLAADHSHGYGLRDTNHSVPSPMITQHDTLQMLLPVSSTSSAQPTHIVAGPDVIEDTPPRVHPFVDVLQVQRSLFRTL